MRNNFEYIGSGTILTSGESLTYIIVYRTVFKERRIIDIIIDLISITPEAVYSYYSSRFKGVI